MDGLTLSEVRDRVDKGCNPVEVAGYGREGTHKGYLTWLLNTWRWPGAWDGLRRLVERAQWPSDSRREQATRWIHSFPREFWCEYERQVGSGKVDLLVLTESDISLPIELKTDTTTGESQLERMSSDQQNFPFGLILCLGSTAIRDDSVPEDPHQYGCFAPVYLDAILEEWGAFIPSIPRPGRDWIQSLRHEQLRLTKPFDLTPDQREQWWEYGYRQDKHLWYALLGSVRTALNDIHSDLGTWRLYDGGYNTVLNLRRGDFSWKPTAGDNAEFFWEFNDMNLLLKVHPFEDRDGNTAREWIEETKNRVNEGYPGFEEGKRVRKAGKKDPWSISVIKWELVDFFSTAHRVADRAAHIIRQCSVSL